MSSAHSRDTCAEDQCFTCWLGRAWERVADDEREEREFGGEAS